ncbi:MAG: glycosyltransferase [Magnetococcales bacterium]|nr:glycosyltransferase [Magnetococcales bacterium]
MKGRVEHASGVPYAAMKDVLVLTPVYNDWESLRILLGHLDALARSGRFRISVVAIDDGSTDKMPENLFPSGAYSSLTFVDVLEMQCNVGHQNAIAIGLAEVTRREELSENLAVVVMDCDGEDDPEDIPRLLQTFSTHPGHIVLAHRKERSEGPVFVIFYHIYKLLFRLATGHGISFGNFCVLPLTIARRLTFMSQLWNSLPASVVRSRIPNVLLPTQRGQRFCGSSHMNFVSLVLHGYNAIAVFSDIVFIRIFLFVLGISTLTSILVILIRFLTDWVPHLWATIMVGFMTVVLAMTLISLISFSLLTLQIRSQLRIVPGLHGRMFLRRVLRVIG